MAAEGARKAERLEREYRKYFGQAGKTADDSVRKSSRFEIFTMYKPVKLTYSANSVK